MNWSSEDDKDRALSVLIAARATDRSITFYWEDIDSCSETNATYAPLKVLIQMRSIRKACVSKVFGTQLIGKERI